MDQMLHVETRFCQGFLIQRQSYHGNYACPHGGVTMSGSDGMDISTQVLVVRSVWVSAALSYHAKHSVPLPPVDPLLKAPGCGCRGPEYVPCQVTSWIYSRQTGDEILLVCVYRDEVEDRLFLGRWPILFSYELWGHIWYGVYGFSAAFC
jgi:hypothetical protein